jgi:quercetin dioxygenase-like cupin family protein
MSLATLGLALAAAAAPALAQPNGIQRTLLQQGDLSAPGYQVIQARVEISPNTPVPRHTHPGEEVTVVLDGALTLEVDGSAPRVYKRGEAFIVPAGKVHGAHTAPGESAVLLVSYVVEKGKPATIPAR